MGVTWYARRLVLTFSAESVRLSGLGTLSAKKQRRMTAKQDFDNQLKGLVAELQEHITTKDGQWTLKGFIDVYRNVYTISSDAKIVSKILEIHLFPKILEFARALGYREKAWLQGSIG